MQQQGSGLELVLGVSGFVEPPEHVSSRADLHVAPGFLVAFHCGIQAAPAAYKVRIFEVRVAVHCGSVLFGFCLRSQGTLGADCNSLCQHFEQNTDTHITHTQTHKGKHVDHVRLP